MVKIDRDRVQAAIASAERRTSAEIVLAVTDVSDDYRFYPLTWGLLAGFVLLGAGALIWPDTHVRFAFVAAGIAAVAIWALLYFTTLGLACVPAAVKARAARGLAHLEFAERVAGRTAKANGLLIFIALGERHVEIVADAGLARSVSEGAWAAVVAGIVENLRAGATTDGVIAGIEACTPILAAAFPPEAGDRNELDDGLVTVRR
ncbi:MAG: TPM domain-containing protein [Rhodospirillaceae bacterium]